MITANDIRKLFFEQVENCLTLDTRAEQRDKLNLIASGMKQMADATIELIELDKQVDEYVERLEAETND